MDINFKLGPIPQKSDGDVLLSVNIYSNQPSADTLVGNITIAENVSGKTITLTDNLVHDITARAIYQTSGLSGLATPIMQIDTTVGSSDVMPQDNAASTADVDALGAFNTTTPFGDITIETSTLAAVGTRSIRAIALDEGNNKMYLDFPVVSGNSYRVQFQHRATQGTRQRIREFIGFTTEPDFAYITPIGSWKAEDVTVIANITGNAQIAFYPAYNTGTIGGGDDIHIDGMTIEDLGVI